MKNWETVLKRWSDAGLVDAALAQRIREFEKSPLGVGEEAEGQQGLRWPVILAIAFGCVLLGAGVLLFVAAHWDQMSPGSRFALVLLMVSLFHGTAAFFTERFPHLGTGLHGLGTIALGAGIYLAGQIFNLAEHWPSGVMLWAIGAMLGWWILRDWVQALLTALLIPAWAFAEWAEYTRRFSNSEVILAQGMLMVAITYLSARYTAKDFKEPVRRGLAIIGAITLIPCVGFVIEASHPYYWQARTIPAVTYVVGLLIAVLLPLALGWWLRGKAVWINVLAGLWVLGLARINPRWDDAFGRLGLYGWCGLGAILLTVWGLKEADKARINLGIAAFAITVLAFYFESVFDMLGRSTTLISLGLIFLLGGWFLEKTRRKLVARVEMGGAQ